MAILPITPTSLISTKKPIIMDALFKVCQVLYLSYSYQYLKLLRKKTLFRSGLMVQG